MRWYFPPAASATSFARPVLTNLLSLFTMRRLKPGQAPSCFAHAITSSLRYWREGLPSPLLFSSSSGLNSSPLLVQRGTLALPSEMHTTTTLPTSPVFWAFIPVSWARWRASARGEPPPQGMVSSLFLVMEILLVGGRRTSACSPWKVMRQTWSRDWYASVRRLIAAPFAASILFIAMDPEASTTKMMSEPAFLAIFFVLVSPPSMNTPRPSLSVPTARARLAFW
mmetsp:Transcript_25592/g.48077  ORF Transcript_25592/g.48077 Transcript_25592/m.48077 type:complete len:225 (+) Transcript_25592:185-859(+)